MNNAYPRNAAASRSLRVSMDEHPTGFTALLIATLSSGLGQIFSDQRPIARAAPHHHQLPRHKVPVGICTAMLVPPTLITASADRCNQLRIIGTMIEAGNV